MTTHLLFDVLAYALAIALAVVFRRRGARRFASPLPARLNALYYFVLTNGVIAGSLSFGTLNLYLAGQGPGLGKSILGAIVGGVLAVEAFKAVQGIRGSTGASLVPGLALGIVVGRLGCFAAGMDDFTYGVPSGVVPGHDFGDGVPRHAVQLYEAFAMLAFFVVAGVGLWREREAWWRSGFYFFAIFYGAQRFAWEFLKPYPDLLAGLNVFHYLCLGLIAYGAVMLGRARISRHAGHLT